MFKHSSCGVPLLADHPTPVCPIFGAVDGAPIKMAVLGDSLSAGYGLAGPDLSRPNFKRH